MEGLAPSLLLCLELRMALERGDAPVVALRKMQPLLPLDLRFEVLQLLRHFEQHGHLEQFHIQLRASTKSSYRRELFQLVGQGLIGAPISAKLKELEAEIKTACEDEVEVFVAKLPLLAMLPVLLVQFPAFLLLLFGPILQELIRSFK